MLADGRQQREGACPQLASAVEIAATVCDIAQVGKFGGDEIACVQPLGYCEGLEIHPFGLGVIAERFVYVGEGAEVAGQGAFIASRLADGHGMIGGLARVRELCAGSQDQRKI